MSRRNLRATVHIGSRHVAEGQVYVDPTDPRDMDEVLTQVLASEGRPRGRRRQHHLQLFDGNRKVGEFRG